MKLTIITAVLNGEGNIHLCLDSLRKQYYLAEHIVVDAGSTDRTLNIIDEYKFSSTQIISEPDNGIYDALNKGIRLAKGAIIGLLHSDDFFANPNGKSNASLKNRLIANHNDRKAWKVNNLKPYPWTLSLKPLRKIKQYFKRPQ